MTRKTKLTKRNLSKLVKQNKSTRFIAQYFHVSVRTIYRRIAKWNLKGIRKHGRKPIPLVKPIPIPKGWILSATYIDKLNRQYQFRNITFLPTKYVNTKTRVCSNEKRNPKGEFTTCTVYYVAFESQLYFLYPMKIAYSRKPKSFNEIYHFMSNRAFDLLNSKLRGSGIQVIEIVALHFFSKNKNEHSFKGIDKETYQTILKRANKKGKHHG